MKAVIVLCTFRKAISFLFQKAIKLVKFKPKILSVRLQAKSQYSALTFSWTLFCLCMVRVKPKTWAEFVHKNQSSFSLPLFFLGWTLTCQFLHVFNAFPCSFMSDNMQVFYQSFKCLTQCQLWPEINLPFSFLQCQLPPESTCSVQSPVPMSHCLSILSIVYSHYLREDQPVDAYSAIPKMEKNLKA